MQSNGSPTGYPSGARCPLWMVTDEKDPQATPIAACLLGAPVCGEDRTLRTLPALRLNRTAAANVTKATAAWRMDATDRPDHPVDVGGVDWCMAGERVGAGGDHGTGVGTTVAMGRIISAAAGSGDVDRLNRDRRVRVTVAAAVWAAGCISPRRVAWR